MSISSFKLQQACKGKLHIIWICPSTSKHLSLKQREAYIEGSGWGLLHHELILLSSCTTGDYLNAEHPLKPLENISMRWQRETPQKHMR
jgi:hypothetical protein